MDIQEYIVAPGNFNFVDLCDEADEADRKTLELFAFGTFETYCKYRDQYERLNGPMTWKLIQLLVLSVVNHHENTSVSIDSVLDQHGVRQGIHWWLQQQLPQLTDVYETFDEVIKDMIKQEGIDARIDHENDSIIVREARALRDVYDPTFHHLQVLQPSDISNQSLINALEVLRNWQNNHVEAMAKEFDITKALLDPNPRKRKSQVLGIS